MLYDQVGQSRLVGVEPGFVGCFERFTSRNVERSDFCRLFRALRGTNSREFDFLSTVRYSWHPQQPTSSSITVFWHSKEEPPQKSRWLFFVLDNLILDKFGLSEFFEKVFLAQVWIIGTIACTLQSFLPVSE